MVNFQQRKKYVFAYFVVEEKAVEECAKKSCQKAGIAVDRTALLSYARE